MLQTLEGRRPDGTYLPGHTTAGKKLYRYAARAEMLQEEFTTGELIALSKDHEAIAKRPIIDTIIIKRLARALADIQPTSCADVERAVEGHLDRIEGTSKLPVDVGGKIVIQVIGLRGAYEHGKDIIENEITVHGEEENAIENGQSND